MRVNEFSSSYEKTSSGKIKIQMLLLLFDRIDQGLYKSYKLLFTKEV